MTAQPLVPALYAGWHTYQALLIRAVAPLSPTQLALRAAPGLRSIEDIATHMIRARVHWLHRRLGEGGDSFAALGAWGRDGAARTAAELIEGLEITWNVIQDAIDRWTPAEWEQIYPGEDQSEPQPITRPWVIWHLIEHDLHHGGEISLTLGLHGLTAPDV